MEDYFDLNNFRYVLELLAAGYAALRITEKELGTLYRYTVALDEAYQSGDYKNVFSAENTFHEYIVLCSKNKYLIDAYKNIEPQMKRYRAFISPLIKIYTVFEQRTLLYLSNPSSFEIKKWLKRLLAGIFRY